MIDKQQIQSVKNRFEIIGNSPLLNRAIEMAIKVATTDITVLILGESGVGKEAFSKIIHSISRRKHNTFIAVNSGAIPSGTIDSELFGHEKGAFTSAHDARKGYFETANNGTIFLDEIGELPLETQSRLLRVLENGEFLKVGSSKVQKTDVRVVAATNRDLLKRAEKGKFREDLYYRLSSVTIHIPALRERKEDIPLLFMKFASDFSDKYKVPAIELDGDAENMLMNYPWPGNIRQLRNVVEQISILETERLITAAILAQHLPQIPKEKFELTPVAEAASGAGLNERELLYKFLFDIKHDVSELKAMMYNLISTLQGRPTTDYRRLLGHNGNGYPETPAATAGHDDFVPHEEIADFGNGEAEPNPTLSLQEQEKEMIKRALHKHAGKRKPAAAELGISERTLYRKIKEFSLEDL
ncbi:AAA domain-containing protein [bacterium]|nr:AAA domain-containing protein [bacterium]